MNPQIKTMVYLITLSGISCLPAEHWSWRWPPCPPGIHPGDLESPHAGAESVLAELSSQTSVNLEADASSQF